MLSHCARGMWENRAERPRGRVWLIGAFVLAASAVPVGADPPPPEAPATQPAAVKAGEPAPANTGAPPAPRTWLQEVVVTASRQEMQAFRAPYSTEVVDLGDFARQMAYRTTTMALSDVPGVMVQKTGQGQGSPFLRGFTGFRTLLLVDGVRINNSVFRDGPNQYGNTIDSYSIRRLEVVRGPSSVLYGSDAIGGTVNAITQSPSVYGEGLQSERRILYRFATADRSHVARGEAELTYDHVFGALVGGTYKRFDDVDGGRFVGPQDYTGYNECAGDAKVEYWLSPLQKLTVAHYNLYQDDAWRVHKTEHGLSWHDTTVGNEKERILDQGHSLTYARYQAERLGDVIDAVEVLASFQQMTERRRRVRSDNRRDEQGVDVDTYGLGLQLQSPLPLGRLTYGAEIYHDEVDSFQREWNADGSFRRTRIQGPVGDDATYDLFGAYVQYLVPLGKSVEATFGGRYTYARAAADRVEDPATGRVISITEDSEALVGSARLSWFLDDERHWNVFGGASHGFRAPNLSDLTRLDTARSNEIETPSPGLDPERFVSYEAGVKADYDAVSAQASGFYTDIRDMIVRTPTGNLVGGDNEVTKKNAGDGGVCGVEMQGRWRFLPQWTAFGSIAYVYGEIDTYPTSAPVLREEPLSRLMPLTGQVGLRWDSPDKKVYVEGVAMAAARQDKLSTRDRGDTQRIPPNGTPGYLVFDLRGGWKVTDDLEVWAGLENLTNRDYRIHGSGVNEPGINFKVGAKLRF